tara:strand:+ start:318 stop:518 length:201 start_codon:yes stop_codon:yes gene_type:complete
MFWTKEACETNGVFKFVCTNSITVNGVVVAIPLENGREVSKAKCILTSSLNWVDNTEFKNGCGVGK